MSKKILWAVMSGLMALSLVMAACAPAATPTTQTTPTAPTTPTKPGEEPIQKETVTPAIQAPKYGGTLNIALATDITGWDDIITRGVTPGDTFRITNEPMWAGDWAKGPAGGHGTDETDWMDNYDVFANDMGYAAESWNWTIDAAKNQGTLIYRIRQGTHYALNPASEASRLVAGREMTADDVVFSLKQMVTVSTAYVYRANIELRAANITKTGPWEVSIRLPLDALITGISRFGNYGRVVPPEVVARYGSMANWKVSVGSGPFMLTDYVPGSAAIMIKNPNYWGRDPVGPGKGSQVPYINGYRKLVIPDLSTRQAALRTGKIDQMSAIRWEDAAQFRKTTPGLLEKEGPVGSSSPAYINTTKAPFTDIRVRRALMMATDFEAIRQGWNGGLGQILTYPYEKARGYEALYLGLDDPEMPASVKDIYTYNPEKAKQLLKEAGYPNGLKTSILLTATEVDYYSIVKGMWAKVGIDLALDVKETAAKTAIITARQHEALSSGSGHGRGPVGTFYLAPSLQGTGAANGSLIDDPIINEVLPRVRLAAITDMNKSMGMIKELMKHVLDQAYAIPLPAAPSYIFWWPWLKNYSGENT
ncbi:MAG: ABC transporter substrate-binding protein, partial [Chloroflexota bacterium]